MLTSAYGCTMLLSSMPRRHTHTHVYMYMEQAQTYADVCRRMLTYFVGMRTAALLQASSLEIVDLSHPLGGAGGGGGRNAVTGEVETTDDTKGGRIEGREGGGGGLVRGMGAEGGGCEWAGWGAGRERGGMLAGMLTYAGVCWRNTVTYADVCRRNARVHTPECLPILVVTLVVKLVVKLSKGLAGGRLGCIQPVLPVC
jgi:hypothetical protein